MTFNPSDPQQLEAFLRDQIAQGRERDKLDFKQEWLKHEDGKTKVDQAARMELLRDINAMVNTFSLDFEDYGFLVFGVNRGARGITHDVPSLRDPGVDNLESTIAVLLGEYMAPQPRFFLLAFDEPGVGTWGALVLQPGQAPPFTFAKDGTYTQQSGKTAQLWRQGEWRLRRNAVTVLPGPMDTAHVINTRIQTATEPLRREVDDLRHRLAVLEGTVSVLGRANQADLEVELVWHDQVQSEVTFIPARSAGMAVLEKNLEELRQLQAKASNRVAELRPGGLAKVMSDRYRDWYDLVQPFDSFINPQVGWHDPFQFSRVHPFMDEWDLNIPEDVRSIQAGFYRPQRGNSSNDEIMGPEAERALAYRKLVFLARQVMPDVTRAAAQSPFAEFRLRIRNTSGVSTGSIRYELQTSRPDALHRYAPGRSNEFTDYHSREREQPMLTIQEQRGELLPGDVWLSNAFALKFGAEEENLTVNVTVFAAGLPQPKQVQLPLRAIPVEAEREALATET